MAIFSSQTARYISIIVFSLLTITFFSYRLLNVPMGLTVDETAFGYNAALLAHSGFDENGRFMPLFVLSVNGQDWRQPITQYYLALLFKIFGPSVYLLRFSSVLITLLSSIFLYYFAKKISGLLFALITAIVYITTPLIMIQSHLGLDNIMPIPFTMFWLFGLYQYGQTKKIKYVIFSAVSLGVSFYSYKGMRAVVPVWSALSVLYLLTSRINPLKSIILFALSISPFLLAVPYLHHLYPGAILGGARPKFASVYDFFLPYLSSFDPTFLYIKGDDTPYHSTGRHGMMLLSTLPIFVIGIISSINSKKPFQRFILLSFFSAPLLYGLVDSVHRASRLMCLIPAYSLICAFGITYILKNKSKFNLPVIIILSVIAVCNYGDFLNYYWNDYAKYTQNFLGDLRPYLSYKQLRIKSETLGLNPYIDSNINNHFFESIYFPNGLNKIQGDQVPPSGSILMTNRDNIPGMQKTVDKLLHYYFQTN